MNSIKRSSSGGVKAIILPPSLTESFEIVMARVVEVTNQQGSLLLLSCEGNVKGCVSNPLGLANVCKHCISVRDLAIEELVPGAEVVPVKLKDMSLEALARSELDDVRSELAKADRSTILTFYRRDISTLDNVFFRRPLFKSFYSRLSKYSFYIYRSIQQLIKERGISSLEFFNGRINPSRAYVLAATHSEIDFSIIEVSGRDRKLLTVDNVAIHDFFYRKGALTKFFDADCADQTRAMGVEFFEKRRAGESTDIPSYTASQKAGSFDAASKKPVLSVFTSSTDEFEFLGDQWLTDASRNPENFIKNLALAVGDEFRIIVRMHPNQAGDKTGLSENMISELLGVKNIELVKPTDALSTYELIDNSFVVLTFGSSVGIEATYWGKSSILVGKAVWEDVDVAYKAETVNDIAMLLSGDVAAKSKEGAIKVAAYYIVGDGRESPLTWQGGADSRFYVDGKNYLSDKRSSLFYYISRAIDKLMRVN